MDIEKAYQELERHLVEGETLLEQLDPEAGLSWRHHEWGEYAKTVIAVIDPHGKIFEKSSPVGMFYDGWNLATFYWEDLDSETNNKRNVGGFASAIGALRAIVRTRPEPLKATEKEKQDPELGKEVFLVHGHDVAARELVARFLQRIGLDVTILHEMPNSGRTIIEKFEEHSEVGYAIALMTSDDIGGPKGAVADKLSKRARQNVVFEFGYFMGKLGRNRVCALVDEGVERPSDYSGLVYIPLDANGAWQFALAKDLKQAGIDVDLNKAI
ncbi:MAG: nucleotide-binding protein [Acidobacteriota bacterium]|nr:nucleotide-binding protein [Acidobacteriota bacterium]